MTFLHKPLIVIADVLIGTTIFILPIPLAPRVLIFVIQFAARRIPFLARGFWLLFGCPPRYITCWSLPGLVLSDEETGTNTPRSGSAPPVLPQQNQENDTEPGLIETATLLVSRHNLDARHACELLAVLRNESGDYLLSANKIRDIVGGADATVKAWVRAMRPETTPTPAQQADRPGYVRNSDGYLIKER
jgi:hypothetical protein